MTRASARRHSICNSCCLLWTNRRRRPRPARSLRPEALEFLRITAQLVRLVSLLLIAGIFPIALWSRPANSPAPAQPLSLPQYVAQLRSASDALASNSPAAAHEFRAALPAEWVVEMDGQTMRVKTDWLANALSAEESSGTASPAVQRRVAGACQRLAALREAAEALAASPQGTSAQQSRARIERILSDREFQGAHGPSWLDKLKARINAWISRTLDKIFAAFGVSSATGGAIAWTLISLITLLLACWAVRYWITVTLRSEMDLRGAAPAGQDWRYWVAEARAAAGRGDYRAAIHATYWAGVARLEEIRLLPEDRSRTPRESLRLMKRGSAAYEPLAQLTRRFEITWYGYRTATSADWDDAMQQLETLGCLRSSTPATADL
jgi:Domain of unknown function (DUF4129)